MMDIKYGRKINGIRRALKAKIGDWLDSIDDDEVRKAANRDAIVTGGAITSMLLGESVNDYDIYFKTKATTKLVAEYYVRKFIQERKSKNDIEYVPTVHEQEDRISIFMKSAGIAADEQDSYTYFEQIDDPDVAEEFAQSTLEDAGKEKPRYSVSFLSQNAITLRNKVQIVIRFYGPPDKIHKNYDFIHATCWYDHADYKLETPVAALQCMLSRTLIYQGSLYPVASIFRMKKFLQRGWRITAGQQMKIMWQISELDLSNFNVIKEQLTGVDLAYMWELINALKDVDPEKINSTYIAAIIDRIFD